MPISNHAHRLLAPIIVLTLMIFGLVIYLWPSADSSPKAQAAGTSAPASSSPTGAPTLPSASTSPTVSPTPTRTATPSPTGSSPTIGLIRAGVPTGERTGDAVHGQSEAPGSLPHASKSKSKQNTAKQPAVVHVTTKVTASATVTKAPAVPHCYDFTYQQDAQAAYEANLSDPGGLDGAPGPYNGDDGLACTGMKVDPSRPASTPVGAYQPPAASAATKAQLVAPSTNYFGVTQDGLPRDQSIYDKVATDAGKAPSALGMFSNWDAAYPAEQVKSSWQHHALPVLTWMSTGTARANTDYSFTNILNGNWDDYLYKFAGDIVKTDLPVVIRFDHEMNGNWYPWSAGRTQWNNSPEKFKQVWQYVWNIFDKVGANDDAIWLFSTARVDDIQGVSNTSAIADDYPGDAYVDWVGASIYWRHSTEPTDYQTSFGKTVSALKAVSGKPLFFAELGALQTDGGTDVSAKKIQWIKNTLAGFLADPRVVGFAWFNNVATTPDDTTQAHDWRFNASATTKAAFDTAIANSRWAAGTAPDSTS